jgi:hypothetical protein
MHQVIVSTIGPKVNAEPAKEYRPVIEYYEPRYSLLIRAHVIGHCLKHHGNEVFLIVQPFASSVCGEWVSMPDDGTTLSICASKMIAQVS